MISEGVQTSIPSFEKLFPFEYLDIPSNTTQVEHSLANYIHIFKNNLGEMKCLIEFDGNCFLV